MDTLDYFKVNVQALADLEDYVDYDNHPIKGYADPIDEEPEDSSKPEESSEPEENSEPEDSTPDSDISGESTPDNSSEKPADKNPATGSAFGLSAAAVTVLIAVFVIKRTKQQ